MKQFPLLLLFTFALNSYAASRITIADHADCILLSNKTTRVVLCPSVGGRVLEYSLNGKHALPLPAEGKPLNPAGRFDVGPELVLPKRPLLWSGEWEGEITGSHSATLVSPRSKSTGLQLERRFTLAKDSSQLRCTQIMKNVSDQTIDTCHWSRTFAVGSGIVYLPTTLPTRFPNHYVMYLEHTVIDVRPEDANIRLRDGILEILGPPENPKLGFDNHAGWMAYHMPHDLMFIKRYPTDTKRVYNEAAGLTASVWYPSRMNVVELEPIGPREVLKPGEQASFTETWNLAEAPFPGKAAGDLDALKTLITTLPTVDSAKLR